MKTLIAEKFKHLLWKDELDCDFILLKYGTIYRYSENALRLNIFTKSVLALVRKMGLILNEIKTDDKFSIVEAKIKDLPRLIALGAFKRRPDLKGKWIKAKERILGHKILPYRFFEYKERK